MRAIRTIVVLVLLALAVLLGMNLGSRKKNKNSTSQKSNTNSEHKRASADTNANPDGFFIGKGDDKVFVRYGTTNAVLQSFMQSVMNGSTDPNKQGQEIFLHLCAACHQPDGEGKLGLAPPLVGSEWALTPNAGRMVRIVLNGVTGPIRVCNQDWNLTMPPLRDALTDDQIAVVLTYVRTRLGTNDSERVNSEFVAAARKQSHPALETPAELMQIPDP